ncbi:MAG: glycosyltransferase family 39 protein [Candidatus Tectimicrobiota bacterium]
MKEAGCVLGVCGVGCLAAIALGLLVLQRFPNSGDEWCYLLQAEIFSQGQLSAPSPHLREFFDVGWMINNGKFYTQHPPGWPLLLAAGMLAGVPWLVNPLLGALTLLVLYVLGKSLYDDRRVAMLAVLYTLGSPFFLFHSASYWAHSSSLLTLSLSLLGLVRGLQKASLLAPLLGGVCGSLSFLIRPLEQVTLLAACGLFCLLPSVRRRHGLKIGSLFCGTHLLGLGLLLGYHTVQNGHPLVSGYQLGYSASGAANIAWTLPTWHYIDDYLQALLLWTTPGLLLAAVGYGGYVLSSRQRQRRTPDGDVLLLLTCGTYLLVYATVAYPSLVGYGPRYYYSLLGSIALLAARGSVVCVLWCLSCLRGQRWHASLLSLTGCFLVALGAMWLRHISHEVHQIQQRLTLQRLVAAQALQHAVVFIGAPSGDFEALDLTRNRLDFQGDIVYALDRGAHNRALMQHYPGRRYFLYAQTEGQEEVSLQEIHPSARR